MATFVLSHAKQTRSIISANINLSGQHRASHISYCRKKYGIDLRRNEELCYNNRQGCALKACGGSHTGALLGVSSKTEEKEKASAYFFRTETAGQVKVSVFRQNGKYVVHIEVLDLSEAVNSHEFTLKWSKVKCNSALVVEDFHTSSNSDFNHTLFGCKSSGVYEAELAFDSHEAPFYLSFFLLLALKRIGYAEIRTHRKRNFHVPVGMGSGHPAPLGVSFGDDGSLNFSLFSRNAESVILCLYTNEVGREPALEIELDPYINRTGDLWHVSLETVGPYTSYGYRCRGDVLLDKGGRLHLQHVLLDPYAKILGSFAPNEGESELPTKCLGRLCKEPSFDWSGEIRPNLPMEKLMVYRLNVSHFTDDKSSNLPNDVAGTFLGLIKKLDHFKSLGVNAVLLEPIFSFDEQKGPYLPYHFFSPSNLYGPKHEGLSSINSMKEMVKTLHAAGIEVLMEVVFSKTAEGGDASSQTITFRGIDNSSYYIGNPNKNQESENALNCNFPVVQQMILDSLRYWVTEFHVDGFCFLDASSLARGVKGEHLSRPPLIEAIAFDPVLSKSKIIADSWSPHEMLCKGTTFPHWKRWAEMNSKFCWDVRNFLRGKGLLSDLATRLCGSGDIFSDGRGPAFSFNFIARNFGLSLVDLVCFSNNELSSELSWNCGEEGPSSNSIVLETRLKQTRNFLFLLYVSLGVPVLNMGDECGLSTGGSPSYELRKSFNWRALRTGFGIQTREFIAFLSRLRRRRDDLLQRKSFMKEEDRDWQANDQSPPEWVGPSSKFLAVTLKSENDARGDIFMAFNGGESSEIVILPKILEGNTWARLVDTSLSFPGFFSEDGDPVPEQKAEVATYEVMPHSCTLFEVQSSIL